MPGKTASKINEREVRLINSMCDQIGVAVENIHLFEQVRSKTAELESSNSELREALEQQTATSEILGVIASSPTDIQPVLDVVAENAARLCDANDAVISSHRWRQTSALSRHHGPMPVSSVDANNLVAVSPAGRADSGSADHSCR